MGKKLFGKCRLCHNDKELCFSHIMPEFLYIPTYDKHHRALMTPRIKEKYPQKGIREYLLCVCCEEVLNRFETYSSPIIKSIQDMNITQDGDQYIIRNVQYTEFKLFQLSLLWRASVASGKMFEKIQIGNHEDSIRKMLLLKNPGMPDQYGCMMIVLGETKYLDKMIYFPVEDMIDGYTYYRFHTGRIFWYFFLPDAYPKDAGNFFLSSEGTLHLLKSPWSEETVIKNLSSIVADKYIHSIKKANSVSSE